MIKTVFLCLFSIASLIMANFTKSESTAKVNKSFYDFAIKSIDGKNLIANSYSNYHDLLAFDEIVAYSVDMEVAEENFLGRICSDVFINATISLKSLDKSDTKTYFNVKKAEKWVKDSENIVVCQLIAKGKETTIELISERELEILLDKLYASSSSDYSLMQRDAIREALLKELLRTRLTELQDVSRKLSSIVRSEPTAFDKIRSVINSQIIKVVPDIKLKPADEYLVSFKDDIELFYENLNSLEHCSQTFLSSQIYNL